MQLGIDVLGLAEEDVALDPYCLVRACYTCYILL